MTREDQIDERYESFLQLVDCVIEAKVTKLLALDEAIIANAETRLYFAKRDYKKILQKKLA